MCTVHCRKSAFAVTVQWTVTAIPKTRENQKKKKNKNAAGKRGRELSPIQTHTTCQGVRWIDIKTKNTAPCLAI